MIVDARSLLIAGVLFLATFIRSAFGFGEALVSVPLLALLIPVEVAAPVAVLVSITVAAIILVQDWRQVHFRSAMWLILFTLLGTPLGLVMLKFVPARVVKAVLAVIIAGFSSYSLVRRHRAHLDDDRHASLFGFVAGVLGGAYGMNGPPLVIYGTLRRWSPQHFRATLQGYFLAASTLAMCGYWLTGLWTPVVTRDYLIGMPGVLLAIFLGRVANRRMSGRSFLLYVHIGLILVAAVLLVQALHPARPRL